jgi:hypothetical protein
VIAAVALVQLILDPTRDLRPVLALAGDGVVLTWVLPRLLRPK